MCIAYYIIIIIEIYGELDIITVYKCFVVYLLDLFIKYMISNDVDFILKIHNNLYDEKFSFAIPTIMIDELKVVYAKMVCSIRYSFMINSNLFSLLSQISSLISNNPYEKRYLTFKEFLSQQNLIENFHFYQNYKARHLHIDLCMILSNDPNFNDNSLLRTVNYILRLIKKREINFLFISQLNENYNNFCQVNQLSDFKLFAEYTRNILTTSSTLIQSQISNNVNCFHFSIFQF